MKSATCSVWKHKCIKGWTLVASVPLANFCILIHQHHKVPGSLNIIMLLKDLTTFITFHLDRSWELAWLRDEHWRKEKGPASLQIFVFLQGKGYNWSISCIFLLWEHLQPLLSCCQQWKFLWHIFSTTFLLCSMACFKVSWNDINFFFGVMSMSFKGWKGQEKNTWSYRFLKVWEIFSNYLKYHFSVSEIVWPARLGKWFFPFSLHWRGHISVSSSGPVKSRRTWKSSIQAGRGTSPEKGNEAGEASGAQALWGVAEEAGAV